MKNDVGNHYIEKRIKENENYEQSVDNEGNETTYFQNKIVSQVLMLLYTLLCIMNIMEYMIICYRKT